jgi:hypothetical protein
MCKHWDLGCINKNSLLVTATNSNSVLPNTASNDIQQHVNSGDVDIRNLTITLIRTVVLQRSWYQMTAVLGNTEFELVVFWSDIHSGNKACSFYLVSVTGRVDFT